MEKPSKGLYGILIMAFWRVSVSEKYAYATFID